MVGASVLWLFIGAVACDAVPDGIVVSGYQVSILISYRSVGTRAARLSLPPPPPPRRRALRAAAAAAANSGSGSSEKQLAGS
jgi:hypothetical protein